MSIYSFIYCSSKILISIVRMCVEFMLFLIAFISKSNHSRKVFVASITFTFSRIMPKSDLFFHFTEFLLLFSHFVLSCICFSRPSMSRGAGLGLDRNHERDFVLSSVEEFVKRFDGTRPINKVIFTYKTR